MSVFEMPSSAPEAQSWQPSLSEESYEAAGWGGEAESALESPFAAPSLTESLSADPALTPPAAVESPFRAGFTPESEADREAVAFHNLLAELADEQFDEAVAQLVDEAAGQHLASGAAWSSSEAAPALATAELEAWIQPLQSEADRMLENMAERLEAEDLESLREPELESLFESLRPDPGFLPEGFENFLGGVFNAAKRLVKGAVSAVGKVASLPVRLLLGKLKGLVRPLLRQVLKKAIGLLPPAARPLAQTLAARLGGESEAEMPADAHDLGHAFRVQAAALALAPDEAAAESIVAEAEVEAEETGSAALHELDQARARLAQQLASLPPGQEPVAELEQFLPVIMAAQQAIKFGIKLIGRDKVVRFLGRAIASLIKGLTGPEAANAIGGPIADAGLKLLGMEAPPLGESLFGEESWAGEASAGGATSGTAVLGSEALVSTIEETVRDVLELPAEAFEDPLRLEAEVQEAFAEAAARNIPSQLLRPDLSQLETAGEGGVWVLMPRSARPRYRYKKYSKVFYVPVTRQVAQAIATRDGGTLETLLADRGVTSWPAHVEVHLFEAVPGTHLGQIAEFEAERDGTASETLDELQPLTEEAAGMLTGEPRLGRPAPGGHHLPGPPDRDAAYHGHHDHGQHRPGQPPVMPPHPAAHPGSLTRPVAAGNRYYRIRVPGQGQAQISRPRHRLRVSFDHRGAARAIHVHLHLGEREAQELGQLLHRGARPATLTWLKHRYHHVAPAILTARLLKHGTALFGREPHEHQAVRLALQLTESMTHALSGFVRDHQAELVTAVQNPAQGLTFNFTFHVADQAALAAGQIPAPHVGVRAGHHHGPHPASVHHRPQAPQPASPYPAGPHPAAPRPAAPRPAAPHAARPTQPFGGAPHHTGDRGAGHRYG
jgi:hypothetical protein